jgi:outer membrane protein assembly factor BamD
MKTYDDSADIFDEVDRQHPYSPLATKAQLMKGVAYYKAQKYPKAMAAIETYIQLHPGHEDAAYAHYLRAMCYYEQIFNVQRDQKMAEKASESLQEVFTRFPESEYARDSKMKFEMVYDHLAGKEMTVGRYYLNKDGYAAAANRFRSVVENYKGTSHVPEALHRLVECYTAMGLEREAVETAAVLGHNFANSPWYADTYYLVKGVDLRQKDASYMSLVDKLIGIEPTKE